MKLGFIKIRTCFMRTFLIFLLFLFNWCGLVETWFCNNKTSPANSNKSDEELYLEAVNDAAFISPLKISRNLIAIIDTNTYIKWKGSGIDKRVLFCTLVPEEYLSEYKAGDTLLLRFYAWVTVEPELKDWFRRNKGPYDDLTLRVEQLLGLPKKDGKYFVVRMWAIPKDVFRPSPDKEINDSVAELEFRDSSDCEYIRWFSSNLMSSYFPPDNKPKYPWTRLGYTYDWGSHGSKIGLSEFVVKKNSRVIIDSIIQVSNYINQ